MDRTARTTGTTGKGRENDQHSIGVTGGEEGDHTMGTGVAGVATLDHMFPITPIQYIFLYSLLEDMCLWR